MMEQLRLLTLNRVLISGRAARDPELRYTNTGKAVLRFLLIASRPYRSKDGNWDEESTFCNVVVWQRLAEISNDYIKKGSAVFVEGRIRSSLWEGEQGESRKTIEIVAEKIQFLNRMQREEVDSNELTEEADPEQKEE
jgi:single-strand DNA-binding protein